MAHAQSPETHSNLAKRASFLGAFLGWIYDYYEVFLLTFLIAPIRHAFNLSEEEGTAIVSVSLFSLAAGGVLFGIIGDRIGRRRVLMITVVTFAAATFARALAPNYAVLLVLTSIAGIGLGGEYGVGQALISETFGAKRRGWWSGLLYSGCFFGIMLASIVGGHLTPHLGWRWTFFISGLPVLVVIYIRKHTPESTVWQETTAGHIPWSQYRTRKFLTPFFKCLILASLYFCAYYGATSLLPQYLVAHGFSQSSASWWIFFTAVAGLIGCLVASWATDVIGRRLTFSCLMTCSTIGTVILIVSGTGIIGSSRALIPFFLIYFGSSGVVFGSLFSEAFPTATRATGVASTLQLSRGVAGIPPFFAAYAISHAGYMPIFIFAVILYVCAGTWVWILSEHTAVPIEEIDARIDVASATPGGSPSTPQGSGSAIT